MSLKRWCDTCDAIVQPLPSNKCPVHACETRRISYFNAKAAPPGFEARYRQIQEANGVKVIDADPAVFDFENDRLGGVGDES